MDNFTPVSGFIGGLMIGGAATLFVLLNGRIAGISGVIGGLFDGVVKDIPWRSAFVAGIIIGPLMVATFGLPVPTVEVQGGTALLVVSGLLVGFGTRLGGGCTSGHGVCGLARGSRRSLVATAVFFAVAAATVYVMRHVVGA